MKRKISTDLSKLSNIPEEYLEKVMSLCSDIIGNAVYESLLSNDTITELDFEFGSLIIKADLKDLKIKFTPSKDLENDLKNINEGKEPMLKHKVEKTVVAKLIDMYKGMI